MAVVTSMLSLALALTGDSLALEPPYTSTTPTTGFETLGGTGEQDDVDEGGLYAAVRWGRMWLPGQGYVMGGDHVAVEVGAALGDVAALGLLLEGGAHNVTHYEVQADDPGSKGPAGDLQLRRMGATGRTRWPVGPVFLGGRAELAYASWRSPFDDTAYQETVVPTLGMERPKRGGGAWLGGAVELGVPLADPGPALIFSWDFGLLATRGLSSSTLGLTIGATVPF